MARIRKSDIEEVRARTNIADVVGDYVTLKRAGSDSMKGLCPFHDERTPSFHVRPQLGYFHCFGCGESGDVFTFLEKIDHITFAEAIERLAARAGVELHYEEGSEGRDADGGAPRLRLLEANAAAATFFQERLAAPEAQPARDFLGGRGFTPEAASRFGVGFAPQSWDALSSHLRRRGFSERELREAGLVSTGERGSYDRFRGRVMWPIRDTSGQTVGFGARRILDDDKGPKYLNTPETAVYHKQRVLFGLDLAKREIARSRQVVVVEGYTDVMAAHLAGVKSAVATCGTAFGAEHIRLLRRIMDDETRRGRVIFNFDPDEAGQKAAMRAWAEAGRFVAQTFVAVAPDGLDPCDLRFQRGDAAVRALIERPVPMYEFVIRHELAQYDLATAEGRVGALRRTAPVVAAIRDEALRPEYTRLLAGWLGMDLASVGAAVRTARAAGRDRDRHEQEFGAANAPVLSIPKVRLADLPDDPVTRLERDALAAVLQLPKMLPKELLDGVLEAEFTDESLGTVRDGIVATKDVLGTQAWLPQVQQEVPASFATLATELSMMPIPSGSTPEQLAAYVRSVAAALIERSLLRRKADLLGSLQRTDRERDPDRYRELNEQLVALEQRKRDLREIA